MRQMMLGIAALLCASCASPTADPSAEAEAAFGRYVEAINEGEIETIANIYDAEPGFHWIEQGGVQYQSGAEATASFEELIATGADVEMTTDTTQVTVLSETSVLLSTHFDFVLSAADGAEPFAFDGWMTVGMAKREDGWKIAGGQTGPGNQEAQ